ncbi:conserved hypothetical protein [Culex quinquefasciatus]|uniref:Ig-like domain-containing protein n=1 Tax=Culex quinquefasciatus TaxID=7176 RepID=B0XEN3_CULQU|nr:conserved hypothetical protein [Culex quinquefasciatus]|eukprot:XP_001868105.1 conserved hypothetical protein [Culex quinquefasciatus]
MLDSAESLSQPRSRGEMASGVSRTTCHPNRQHLSAIGLCPPKGLFWEQFCSATNMRAVRSTPRVLYGPHFETDNVTNITVQNGDDLFLSCRISLLQDKTVSWVRRKHGETDLQLLTVGKQTYSGDPRYTIEFQYPNNWRLKIAAANKNDEGVYECQISTHPPKVIIYYLHVNERQSKNKPAVNIIPTGCADSMKVTFSFRLRNATTPCNQPTTFPSGGFFRFVGCCFKNCNLLAGISGGALFFFLPVGKVAWPDANVGKHKSKQDKTMLPAKPLAETSCGNDRNRSP